jgi:4-hydroxybenzoate polyprenyltransferase
MKHIIKFLSFSNIWIGLGACLLSIANLLALRWLPNMQDNYLSLSNAKYLLVFNFFATVFIYTFIRLLGLREKHPQATSEMLDWVRKNKIVLILWTIVSGIISIYWLYHLHRSQQYIILSLGALSILYAMPVYKSNGIWKSLRHIPYIKTIIVAIVWSVLTVICVVANTEMYPVLIRPQHILLTIINFIFILALTIPFDIRDIAYDSEVAVKTIAQKLGIEQTKKLSIGLLILYMVLSFILYIYWPCYIYYPEFFRSFNLATFVAAMFGGLGSIFIIKNISASSDEQVYTFQIDGMIVVQSIFMILIYSIYYIGDLSFFKFYV